MLYIRADMNQQIATGHIMRCLSIADAARNLNEETVFIVADRQAVSLLESRGYAYIVLETEWNHLENELPKLESIISEYNIDKLLIDSYMVTEKYLQCVSQITYTIYIDDLNMFHYPVDSIISYANYADEFCYEKKYEQTELLLGTKFAPLKPEFSDCLPKRIRDKAEYLLIICGGTDNYHIILNVLNGIDMNLFKKVSIICGRYSQDYETIKEKYMHNSSIQIMRSVDGMKEFFEAADIVISAAGTTLYELCAVGTPTISYTLADNQIRNATRFQKDGIIDYAGDVRFGNYVKQIKVLLGKMREDKDYRKHKAVSMQKLIDGKGAKRIAEHICYIYRRR